MSVLIEQSGRMWFKVALAENKEGLTPLALARLLGTADSSTGLLASQLEETARDQFEALSKQDERHVDWTKLFSLVLLLGTSYATSGLTSWLGGTVFLGRVETVVVCLVLAIVPESIMDIGYGGLELGIVVWILLRALCWYLSLSWTALCLSWLGSISVIYLTGLSAVLKVFSYVASIVLILCVHTSPYTSLLPRISAAIVTVCIAFSMRAVSSLLPSANKSSSGIVNSVVNSIEVRKALLIAGYWLLIGVLHMTVSFFVYSPSLSPSSEGSLLETENA